MRDFIQAAIGCFFAGVVSAQALLDESSIETASQLRETALASDLSWQILESLTTEVGPRMAGSPGDERAVAWARAKFQDLGFDRIAAEPVSFPRWTRGAESGRVLSPFPQAMVLTALGGSVGTDADGLEGQIAHFADLDALRAVEDGSLAGQIAFVSNRMQRARDGSGYGPAVVARRDGASIAAAKGASAILIRSIGTDSQRFAHTGLLSYDDAVGRIPAAALSNPDADQLVRILDRGQPVHFHLKLDVGHRGEAISHNVIGEIRGAERPDELIVIGCHLDSWDQGTGAIDDGAGCAITMAAARLIAELPQRPRRTIRVVLWANEEQGLIGARAYAEAHMDELERHILGAESDFGAGRIYRFSTRVEPQSLAVIDQISQALAPLGIVRGDNNAFGGPDLIPMRRAGMAVATLHQDGSDYFDWHHTPNDTLDKVDPEALRQNTAAYAVFAWLAAQSPTGFGSGLGLSRGEN